MQRWQEKGSCRDSGLNFYGPVTRVHRNECAKCPVLDQCRDYAIWHEEYGFWGGMSEGERASYREANGITMIVPERITVFRKTGPRAPIKHGTLKGYRLETKWKIPHCEACKVENKKASRKYRAEKAREAKRARLGTASG